MALTTCRECNAPVSTEAPTCPQCGVAKPGKKPPNKALSPFGIICGLTFGLGCIAFLANREMAPRTVDTSAPPARIFHQSEDEERLTAAISTAEILRSATRNPSTFALISVLAINASPTLCFEFRGQNGFGGMTVSHAVYDMKKDKLTPENEPGFSSIWQSRCYRKPGEEIVSSVNYGLR